MNRLIAEKITRALERLRDRVAGNEIRIDEVSNTLLALKSEINTQAPISAQNGVDGVSITSITGEAVEGRYVLTFALSDGTTSAASFDLPKNGADGQSLQGEVGPMGPAGPQGLQGERGSDGQNGERGVGIADVRVIGGRLVVGLDDERVIDAGSLHESDERVDELPFYIEPNEQIRTEKNKVIHLELNAVFDGFLINDGLIMEKD